MSGKPGVGRFHTPPAVGTKVNMLTYVGPGDRVLGGDLRKVLVRGTFLCDCGQTTLLSVSVWTNGRTKSCGCLMRNGAARTHGMSRTGMYASWKSAHERSRKRGTSTVDPRWTTFQGFLDHPPDGLWVQGYHLCRTWDTGPYSPENCRWCSPSANHTDLIYSQFAKAFLQSLARLWLSS